MKTLSRVQVTCNRLWSCSPNLDKGGVRGGWKEFPTGFSFNPLLPSPSSDGEERNPIRFYTAPAVLVFLTVLLIQIQAAAQTADTSRYLDQFVDTSANPADDFSKYAYGKWIKNNPIPANERSWGIGKVVQEETYQRLLKVSEEATADQQAVKGTNRQKIGDFWYSGMDTVTIEKLGISALQGELDSISAIQNKQQLLEVVAHLQYIGVGAMFSVPIFQDEMNSEQYALHLYQGGLGLPNRDYYFDDDERTKNIRTEYAQHLSRIFQLMGDSENTANQNAATVMRIETRLAKSSRKLEDLRDLRANYNKMSLKELSDLTPSIHWKEFFIKGNILNVETVVVGQPEFFKEVEQSLNTESIDSWKTYLRWQLVNTFADKLSSNFDQANFHFYGTVLNGTPEQRPRWKRILDNEEFYLGDALGQLYVQQYFSPETKVRYEKLVDVIFAACAERIKNLDWMSAATKQQALKKLSTVTKKVGYPEKWRDYSDYQIDRTSYVMNCIRGNIWLSDFYIRKLNKPVDRTEWGMTPQTYNAYYNPSNNEIVLPAAIFILPGIDDSLADDAIVYAYAGGTTIGHEIIHGFDDQGRQFDEKGNLTNWWTKEDEEKFNEKAKMIIKQYDDYVVVDGLRANGKATQGENIADLGGIMLAWDAFTKTEEYQSGKEIGGLTPAQRFFIGWALGWMNNMRPETLSLMIKTNVHAPSFLRVNGPVSNMPQFYKAFNVKPGDPMFRPEDQRVRIW